jgi:sensor histidine kinase regulating citrate/malate metabolism
MNIGDLLSYAAPTIPAVTSIVNDWKEWRKKHRARTNIFLLICAVLIAWILILRDSRQHHAETDQLQNRIVSQARVLFNLQNQNQNLIKQSNDMQNDLNALLTRNQDLQNDMNALRHRFNVKSYRTREIGEHMTTSDSVEVTVHHASHP